MNKKEIYSLVDQTVYDFDTIELFLQNGRLKESVLIMGQILDREQFFRQAISAGPQKIKELFVEVPGDCDFLEKVKAQEGLSEKSPLALEYQHFIRRVRLRTYDHIYHLRQALKSPVQKKLELAVIALSTAVLGLCLSVIVMSIFIPQPVGSKSRVILFEVKDVVSGSGWIQDVRSNNPKGWPTKSQLVVKNANGLVSVKKDFEILKRGNYLITVYHSSNRNNVKAEIKISCIDHGDQPMATLSSSYKFGKDTYVCEFPAGSNSISITGRGNEKNPFLGVNSVSLREL